VILHIPPTVIARLVLFTLNVVEGLVLNVVEGNAVKELDEAISLLPFLPAPTL